MAAPHMIGVIHLPPLPGSPGAFNIVPAKAIHDAGIQAVAEAQAMAKAGFRGVIIENFGDVPFYKDRVPPETIASMAILAAVVRESVRIPVGINVLRNDARSAMAIAGVAGCDFIRVNVLSGVSASDQGILEGDAAFLIRERDRLGAPLTVFADVLVKHALSLSNDSLESAVEEAILRAGADGVIVTGPATGKAPHPEWVQLAAQTAHRCGGTVFLGSGATAENIGDFAPYLDAVIVGSALRKKGLAGQPLDMQRLRRFVEAVRKSGQRRAKPRKKTPVRKKKTASKVAAKAAASPKTRPTS